MHSIADVSLRENGTKKRKVGWDEAETEGAQTRHRVPQSSIVVGRKSIRPEASYLKVCIGQRRKTREKERERKRKEKENTLP